MIWSPSNILYYCTNHKPIKLLVKLYNEIEIIIISFTVHLNVLFETLQKGWAI